MIWWDGEFEKKLNYIDIQHDLVERFVDDINGIFMKLKPGTEYKDGKIRYNPIKAEADKGLEDDFITMSVIKDIANDIDEMITMTVDVPSNHETKKMPILDLEVWLNMHNEVDYNFFEKPMRNILVIGEKSALPRKTKMTILTQEVFRRLHNTKESLNKDVINSILNKFMFRMKVSGYNEQQRFEVLKSGFATYENIRKLESEGKRPFF